MNKKIGRYEKGFVLVACLLLLLLMSTLAIALMLRVRTEASIGANDLQNNIAFHAAEGAIEKQTSDLSNMFLNIQAPQVSDYTDLDALQPTIPGVTLSDYHVSPVLDPNDPTHTKIKNSFGQITSGPNQGLYAQLIPITLTATATSGLANQVRMVRTAEVALIPIFQFGVFSQGDLSFFSSPNLDFNGRVHTNGDLYVGVGSSNTITFHDKVTAYGNVIRKVLPNGLDATNTNYNDKGNVYLPTADGGCDGSKPHCSTLSQTQGSVTGGPTSGQNSSWPTISKTTFNGKILTGNYGKTGGTGANCLSLPFTTGSLNCPTAPGQYPSSSGAQPYEIIRRPPAGESSTAAVAQARLFNQAQIRILLADDPAENHLDGSGVDGQDIRLANIQTTMQAPDYSHGVPASVPTGTGSTTSGQAFVTYFAEASTAVQDPSAWTGSTSPMQYCLPSDWTVPSTPAPTSSAFTLLNYEYSPVNVLDVLAPVFNSPAKGYAPFIQTNTSSVTPPSCFATPTQISNMQGYSPTPSSAPNPPTTWNLIDGYLRVEYADADGNFHPVTQEWLELGFARGLTPPKSGSPNPVNPNAILIFQQIADRNGDGSIATTATAGKTTGSGSNKKVGIEKPADVQSDPHANNKYYYGDKADSTSPTRYNWYPLNFYDAREGEPRDVQTNNASCGVLGVMNAVELDVGNLKKWLAGTIGTSGTSVDSVAKNGYIVYFSDRRGMLKNPSLARKSGDSGLEDVVNSSSSAGTNDGILESPSGKGSPEDVNLNGVLDNYGAANVGLGSGMNSTVNASSTPNYFARVSSCVSTARKNYVSGARHVLKLVNGSLGNLPTKPDGTGGFTVGSENPVYIQGDYNTSSSDPTWTSTTASEPAHSAAGILADAVTVLSNSWDDRKSLGESSTRPSIASDRPASTTYYRVAISAGKNRTFPAPSYTQTSTLYSIGTDGGLHNFIRFLEDWSSSTLYYKGSLVSLYYSTYATGIFKCCAYAVYQPPNRNYVFDPLFTNPANLPPGTPMFRDVNNLTYTQDLTPR